MYKKETLNKKNKEQKKTIQYNRVKEGNEENVRMRTEETGGDGGIRKKFDVRHKRGGYKDEEEKRR